jgi:hypothetical protein
MLDWVSLDVTALITGCWAQDVAYHHLMKPSLPKGNAKCARMWIHHHY